MKGCKKHNVQHCFGSCEPPCVVDWQNRHGGKASEKKSDARAQYWRLIRHKKRNWTTQLSEKEKKKIETDSLEMEGHPHSGVSPKALSL